MEYRFRIGQNELKYIFTTAKDRIKAHPEVADKHKKTISECSLFKSEREALKTAIKKAKENPYSCQIWAKIEKVENIYHISGWLVTDEPNIKLSAEYIGMSLMYDESRISKIIDANIEIDDVIAYY